MLVAGVGLVVGVTFRVHAFKCTNPHLCAYYLHLWALTDTSFKGEALKSGTSVMFDKNYVFSIITRAKGSPFETGVLTNHAGITITHVIFGVLNG